MKRYHGLLLQVWRESCRHIAISESTATITAVLAKEVPVQDIIVRRIDLQHASLEIVAVGLSGPDRVSFPGRDQFEPEDFSELISWAGQTTILRGSAANLGRVSKLIGPPAWPSDWLAGPLIGSDGPTGVLTALARTKETFGLGHEQLFKALLEPFSVALENDRRLHELAMLREVAEAERRSLLVRLGRRQLANPIIGADAGLRHVLDRVQMVSRSNVPVLLLGETGTGKEVIARTIHDRSPRHAGPFIRVNCGAIPSELIDSQLFGHERGSFTGAVDTRKGWFERADAGTLFLDEIGELPPAAQVRLLRVLQDGFIERVGGQGLIHVDVRVVAATHCQLANMVQDGRFRQDLWYRLAVFPIPIPPLRERPEDIPTLACHFAEKAATRFGLPLVMPTPEDTRLLTAYAWPGNVRELGTVIDRAALLGNGRQLEVATALGTTPLVVADHRPPEFGAAPAPSDALPATAADTDSDGERHLSLDRAMQRHIEAALRLTHGRIEGPFGAAKRLKVNPHTLRARMRKLGIDWRQYRLREEA